jgi:DNA (cytosine-5)-methyltransferase 1
MYKVVSLFCGCGGSDLGIKGGFNYLGKRYKKHPITIVSAIDIDKKAVLTYNKNFKEQAKVIDIKSQKYHKNFADIVIGGFPCQSFSSVNPNKNPEDDRGLLFYQMARVISEINPKVFIAENVKGFLLLHKSRYFLKFKKIMEKSGYDIFHTILRATNYGVPQKRERLFIIGIRKDLNKSFEFPRASHGESKGQIRVKVLKDVIDNLIPDDPKYYFSEKAVQGVKKAKNNMKRALAQDLNQPCLTISSHLAKVSLNSRDPVLLVNPSKELYRRFTPREAARIQSFPDKFIFAGSDADAYRQIGNAIPPIVMWNIMNELIKQKILSPTEMK